MARIISVSDERVTLPNGVEAHYQFVHHPGGAAVVALDVSGNVALLRQYRPVAKDWLWEVPAGKRDNHEEPLVTAQRELQEEAGISAASWCELGSIYSSPGVFTEVIHLFLATGLTITANQPEEHELFELHWMSLDEAVAMAQDGRINDAKSIIALLRSAALIASGDGACAP